jgi:hypothetical protein
MQKTLLKILIIPVLLVGYGAWQYNYNETTYHNHWGAASVVFYLGDTGVQLDYGMANPDGIKGWLRDNPRKP